MFCQDFLAKSFICLFLMANILVHYLTVHQNFVGVDGNKSPFILSVCLTDSDNYGAPQYRAVLWRKTVRILFYY